MDRAAVLAAAQRIGVALAACIIPSIVLPLGAAILLGLPLAPVYGLIASAFLIEYGAIPIGIGLGLPATYVFCAATAIEAGIFLGIYGVLDLIGHTSKRVAGLLSRVHAIATRSRMFDRYGILGPLPVRDPGRCLYLRTGLLALWVERGQVVCDHDGRIYCCRARNHPCHPRCYTVVVLIRKEGRMSEPIIPGPTKIPELLAPAGSPEAFRAAIAAGADAVYLSGKQFGARKFAKNFS